MEQDENKRTVFYHGTSCKDFEKFDEKRIGTAHDRGWYGHGFYFCYTAGEASYYGPYVRAAKLNIKNPFFFQEELGSFENQHLSIFGDMSAFAINLSKKFSELANKVKICAVISYDDMGYAQQTKMLTLKEYAKRVLDIYNDQEFSIFECVDRDKSFFAYKYKEDYNCLHYRFRSRKEAELNRLDMATIYVHNNLYAHVETHIPEHFMEDIAQEFSNILKSRGYDGIFQSKDGDEVVCFYPEQVEWV